MICTAVSSELLTCAWVCPCRGGRVTTARAVSRRSVRQECLDHLLIFHEKQLQRVLNAYVAYFNQARPHQGIGQQIPVEWGVSRATQHEADKVIAVPILGGLHNDYQWVA